MVKLNKIDELIAEMDIHLLQSKRKTDRLLRFNVLVGTTWIILAGVNFATGHIYLALTYVLMLGVYAWVTKQQIKHFRYWWRLLRPTYVSLDTRKSDDPHLVLWLENKFGYNCYCHGHGIFAFRYPKHATAFKLRWSGI